MRKQTEFFLLNPDSNLAKILTITLNDMQLDSNYLLATSTETPFDTGYKQ